jgi:lipoyl(octanoyl) transferase
MMSSSANTLARSLQVYLLGTVDFESALRLQRHLADWASRDRDSAALVLCEHPPLITVGRHGGPRDIGCEPQELCARRWRIRWVPRGGGCLLHLPGQLAVYPVLTLDRLELDVPCYLEKLHRVLRRLLDDFGIAAESRPGRAGLWVGPRLIAHVGVAVRDGITSFGAALNVDPDLSAFRLVCPAGADPMTSLARERRGPLRAGLVRQRLLEHFAFVFGFDRTDLLFHHPLLGHAAGQALARQA